MLFIVSVPIGNVADLSPRAREVLGSVAVVACEDTRKAGLLLQKIGVSGKRLVSYYDQVEKVKAEQIVRFMTEENQSVALISDAGTPAIADPGYRLVAAAHGAGIPVVPVPGASALLALVAASGLPNHRLTFLGFLPQKKAALRTELAKWPALGGSVVFFESPLRLLQTLSALEEVLGDVQIAVGKELTKTHECIVWGRVSDVGERLQQMTIKGEFVVMVALKDGDAAAQDIPENIQEKVRTALVAGLRVKDIVGLLDLPAYSRKELYQFVQGEKDKLTANETGEI